MNCDDTRARVLANRQSTNKPVDPKYKSTRKLGSTQWIVGMTVAYRETSTVADTLKSLAGTGFPKPTLFAELGSNGIPESAYVEQNNKVLGNWGNFCKRVEWFLEVYRTYPSNTKYLLVQDDVEFLPDTKSWVHFNWPVNDGPVSLYRTAKYPPVGDGPWSVLDNNLPFLGMLAMIVSREHLLILRDNIGALTISHNDGKQDDVKFGKLFHALSIPINIANASRCQHTGVVSSLYPTKGLSKLRKADTYTSTES